MLGKVSLDLEYQDILYENQRFHASASTDTDSEWLHDMTDGANQIPRALRLNNFMPDKLYHFQASVNFNEDGDIAMKGTIVLSVADGEPDFYYQGTIRFLTVDGYEIIYDEDE